MPADSIREGGVHHPSFSAFPPHCVVTMLYLFFHPSSSSSSRPTLPPSTSTSTSTCTSTSNLFLIVNQFVPFLQIIQIITQIKLKTSKFHTYCTATMQTFKPYNVLLHSINKSLVLITSNTSGERHNHQSHALFNYIRVDPISTNLHLSQVLTCISCVSPSQPPALLNRPFHRTACRPHVPAV